MTPQEQKAAAKEFADYWKGKGYEKGQTQPFWIGLLRVLGVEHPDQGYVEFEDRAHIDSAHGFIDGYIPATRVLIEQKSLGKSLRAGIPQSDGSVLTPFQQAKRYCFDLPVSRHPRWVVTCNFEELLVHDMERPNAEPESILLANLPDELYRLSFLVATEADFIRREEEISKAAGDVVGRIYDAFLKQYRDPSNPATLKSLNELCVRLVFLFYAEDAGVFRHLQFRDYLKPFPAAKARGALLDLFRVLDTPPAERDPYLDPDLAAFPYVNGGLFANAALEVPQLTDEILSLIVKNGSEEFDWKDISPTIFGAVFESTLNPETRRSGGMHYTSLANIHKVIGPLFLDGLTSRVDALCQGGNVANVKVLPMANANAQLETGNNGTGNNGKWQQSPQQRRKALRALQDELASLTFLDPACGSGNFLTETYVCLRRLENRIIAALQDGQGEFDLEGDAVKVSIRQFHGIEINDFAVAVAKSALWIAESQMLNETQALLHRNIDFLPLKTYDGIVEGNALRMDWSSLAPRFDYIMGNPPFVGARLMSAEQKADVESVFGADWKGLGNLDYVACWYKLAADCMAANPATRTALVSTNSICQGDAVATLWQPLFGSGVSIDFAHRTFRWDSESNSKAHVHCVIVGFSCDGAETSATSGTLATMETLGTAAPVSSPSSPRSPSSPPVPKVPSKPLFEGDRVSLVPHINAYLLPAPDAFVESRREALCAPRPLVFGSMPNDGGFLSDWSPERRAEVLAKWPEAEPLFRRIIGSHEYINSVERWCLWLLGASPALIRSVPPVLEAVDNVRSLRLASKRAATHKLAETPSLFGEIRQPTSGNYIVVPSVSSERRRYVPMGFLPADVIANNLVLLVPDASLYHFGVLTSNVHMAWMRAVAGRLEMRYRYSAQIVYNNFPWPEAATPMRANGSANASPEGKAQNAGALATTSDKSELMKARIEQTAQAILDARAHYPDASLADLYDELTMPPDLRKAHQENDRAVMAAYGFPTKMTESECVAELFKRYQTLVAAKEGTKK